MIHETKKKSFFWIWPCLDLRCIFSRLRFFTRSGDSKISFNAFYLFDSGTLEPQPQFLHSCHQRGSDGWSLIKNSHILVLILCSGSSYFRPCLNVLWWLRLFSYMFLWERQNISKATTIQSTSEMYNMFFCCYPNCFSGRISSKKAKKTKPKQNQNPSPLLLESSDARKCWPKVARQQVKQDGQDEEEYLI